MNLRCQRRAKPSRFTFSRVIGLVITATAVTGALAFYGSQFGTVGVKISQPAASISLKKVTALGRLEPATEVVQLSAPVALDGDRLAQLLVKEGDRVKARQVVAIFDSRDRLQDELRQIQEQVKLTQAKLNQVKAGAKTGEIQAQQATIVQLQAEIDGDIATQNAALAFTKCSAASSLTKLSPVGSQKFAMLVPSMLGFSSCITKERSPRLIWTVNAWWRKRLRHN